MRIMADINSFYVNEIMLMPLWWTQSLRKQSILLPKKLAENIWPSRTTPGVLQRVPFQNFQPKMEKCHQNPVIYILHLRFPFRSLEMDLPKQTTEPVPEHSGMSWQQKPTNMCFKVFSPACNSPLLIINWLTVTTIDCCAHSKCIPSGNSDKKKTTYRKSPWRSPF